MSAVIHEIAPHTKKCAKCSEVKSVNEFHRHSEGGELHNRPDRVKRLYGITYEDVVRALDNQHGLCANRACGKEITLNVKGTVHNRAVIDHNHKTGKFRALLCPSCNTSLGVLETKRNICLGLIDYLIKYTKE